MIFKQYYIKEINSNSNEDNNKEILESIARKFNSEYDEFIKNKIDEEKIVKLKDIGKSKVKEEINKKEKYYKENEKKIIKKNYYYLPSFKNKLLYYNGSFYVYTPSGTKIERVSQAILGHNVLGRAFPGLNIIQILDTLYGLDFEEVKKHEVNHIIYPFLTEEQIRLKTKQELPFYTRYH